MCYIKQTYTYHSVAVLEVKAIKDTVVRWMTQSFTYLFLQVSVSIQEILPIHKNKYHLHWSFLKGTAFLVLNRLFLIWFNVNEIST